MDMRTARDAAGPGADCSWPAWRAIWGNARDDASPDFDSGRSPPKVSACHCPEESGWLIYKWFNFHNLYPRYTEIDRTWESHSTISRSRDAGPAEPKDSRPQGFIREAAVLGALRERG